MSVEGSKQINIGKLSAGDGITVSWNIKLGKNFAGSLITVTAGGSVSSTVPEADWKSNGAYYPAYGYTDWIGGEAFASIKL